MLRPSRRENRYCRFPQLLPESRWPSHQIFSMLAFTTLISDPTPGIREKSDFRRPGREMERFAMTRFPSVSRKFVLVSLALIASAFILTITLQSRSAYATPAPQSALRMTCSSDDMHRHFCAVDTTGGVQMVHQKSEAKCIQDRTWGFDKRGIWVDRGCRAEFEVGGHLAVEDSRRGAHDGGRDRVRDNDRAGGRDGEFRGWGDTYMVYCASDAMERVWCPADSRFGVRMIRQRSQAGCIEGETWGYGKRGIWVDRGCRADFRVTGDWQSRAAALIYCPSDYMNRAFCPVDTRDGVFIIRQRSEADCVFNRTWGYDRDRIWVDRGCRADFEIVDRRDREWHEWSRDWSDDDRRGWDRDHGRDRERDRDRDRDDRDRDRDDRPRDDRPPFLN